MSELREYINKIFTDPVKKIVISKPASKQSEFKKITVAMMPKFYQIAKYTEKKIDYKEWFKTTDYKIKNILDAVSHATCSMAIDVEAKCIVVNSKSGQTARMVSRFRSPADILGNYLHLSSDIR